MKLRAEIITAIFGIYFVTVISGAVLVASKTEASWYDAPTSSMDYTVYLATYLAMLIAIALFGSFQRSGTGPHPSLAILAGPAIVAAVYVGIASMLLPGAGGLLQTNFKLNTAVILSMAYSWLGLALYFASAMGFVAQQKRIPPPEVKATQPTPIELTELPRAPTGSTRKRGP